MPLRAPLRSAPRSVGATSCAASSAWAARRSFRAFDRELTARRAEGRRTDRTSEAALKRFRREVAIARDAAGCRLVVFDIGQSGDTVFLTMELVDGESLRELLGRGRSRRSARPRSASRCCTRSPTCTRWASFTAT
ncbi:MAG: hypothetical protein IPN03_15650 [Holophagales bacterium]|nr:hypothetical protein [Holophagales bacterium]